MSDIQTLAQTNGVFLRGKRNFTQDEIKSSQLLANHLIRELNLGISELEVDGIYGPKTQEAWRTIQIKLKELGCYGGRIDGLHGPITSDAIRRYLSNQYLSQNRNAIPAQGLALSSETIRVPNEVQFGIAATLSGNQVELIRLSLTKEGDIVTSRELLTAKHLLEEKLKTARHPARYQISAAIGFINRLLQSNPQATAFRIEKLNGETYLRPLVVNPDQARILYQSDVVIVGAELESVTTALHLKRRNPSTRFSIVVPCSCNQATGKWEPLLGGISSDKCANMRYFDYPTGGNIPDDLKNILKETAGVDYNNRSIQPGLSDRLLKILEENGVEVIKVRSLDTMMLNKSGRKINSVYLEDLQGLVIEVRGKNFLDMDPESRLTEKAVGRPHTLTPRLGYGVVLSARNLEPKHLDEVLNRIKQSPDDLLEQVLNQHGFTTQENHKTYKHYSTDPKLNELVELYKQAAQHVDKDLKKWLPSAWGGLRTLKILYDIYTWAAWSSNRSDSDLSKIVMYRFIGGQPLNNTAANGSGFPVSTDGFNIAISASDITFNSLNYALPRMPQQYSHDLRNDPEYGFIRTDARMFERFLRTVTGNNRITVQLPKEFYIRSSGFSFSERARHQYVHTGSQPNQAIAEHFYDPNTQHNPVNIYELAYLNDFRANYSWHLRLSADSRKVLNRKVKTGPSGKIYWTVSDSTCQDKHYDNLWIISKNIWPPELFGAMRIVPNQAAHGLKIAETISGS